MDVAAFEEVHGVVKVNHRDLGAIVFLTDPTSTSTSPVYPGLKIPFDLKIENFPHVMQMLQTEPKGIETANMIMKPPLADSTIKAYAPVIADFADYCALKSLDYPLFSQNAVLAFLAHCNIREVNIHYIMKVVPSLAALENILDRPGVAITPIVTKAVNSIIRELSKHRQPVKKATPFPISNFEIIISKEIYAHEEEIYRINAANFRAVFRAVIIYFTFCRFSDFNGLTDSHFNDKGDCIEITFPKSKNDQYFKGSSSVITEKPDSILCPVRLTRLYFKRFHLKFKGNNICPKFINFRLRKQNGFVAPVPGERLAVSNAVAITRKLLNAYGFDGSKYTEKSMKVAGVTALCDYGEPLENVSIMGRWRTSTMPMHYRNTSLQFKKNIASNIPV